MVYWMGVMVVCVTKNFVTEHLPSLRSSAPSILLAARRACARWLLLPAAASAMGIAALAAQHKARG